MPEPDRTGRALLIRADAGAEIGAGHLMRCLALGEAWRRSGGEVLMVTNALPDGLRKRIGGIGAAWLDAARLDDDEGGGLASLARRRDCAWIVLDGYRFGPDVMGMAGASGIPVLAIDDDARRPEYPVRALLNQNLHARAEHYAGKTEAALLLGPRHALLRGEFFDVRHWRRPFFDTASKVLVTFGGADPGGHTLRAVQALAEAPGEVSARVIVGAANPSVKTLRALAATIADVELILDAGDMSAHMRWCDVALSAAGSTVWELALFQTPMVLGSAARVEEPVAASLAAAGAAHVLGRLAEQSPADFADGLSTVLRDGTLRRRLGSAAGDLVDGEGADRVVQHVMGLSASSG